MKLSNRQLRSAPIELSMTSMIDVVFLLLIFFIVTTTFIRPEREVVSGIKVNEQRAADQPSNLEPAIVDIVMQNSQALFRIGALRTNDLEEVKTLLNGFEIKSEGAFVRVAGNVPYEAAAQAIGACHASGFASVSYLPLD
ncbi:MAG: biopolymer transport protein ExbD [Mariniblastus sp.]|jgi:biopolymer transport protein ExbD